MIQPGSVFTKKVLLAILILIPFKGLAQRENQNHDTLKSAAKDSRHSLFAGIGYGSNMIYMGSTISRNLPFEYASLIYGYKSAFYASASAVHLADNNPFLAFYYGSLNYNHTFNSWFDISAGVYRYQVIPSLRDTLFNSFTYGDITLGFDWKLLYTKLSAGGLLADENRAFLQIRNSRYFQTGDFFKDKFNISFDPYVNLLFGTLLEAKTTTGTVVRLSPPYGRWKRFIKNTTYTSYTKKFGFMEVDFGLPVALNADKMTVEAEVDYIIPVYDDPELPGPKGFVFMLSAYFRIF